MLEAVVREASCEPKPILFIDEIHLLLGAGSASGSMDALGSGVVKKRRMGFGAEEDEEVGETPTLIEAVKRHFRPELVNRLTKVVHFKPLGMDTAREIFGKLLDDFNKRLTDRVVTVDLDASAIELILREGFSEEYGARNLERVMDRMLGTLIVEALLGGEISKGQTIRVTMEGVSLGLHAGESP